MKGYLIVTTLLLFSGLIGLGPATAQEQVFQLGNRSGIGAKALGMGGAYTAVSEDYSATFWNPAGLAQVRKMEMSASLAHVALSNEATFKTQSILDEVRNTRFNSFGFVFPVPTYRGSLVFGLGYNRVKDFDDNFSFKWFNPGPDSVDQSFTERENGTLNQWVMSGAVDVSPNLSVGASLNIWTGNDDYTFTKIEEDPLDIWRERKWKYIDNINTSYNSFNIKLGGLYRIGSRIRLGATLTTPMALSATEEWSADSTIVNDDGSLAYRAEDGGDFDYKLYKPLSLEVGGALQLMGVLVSGDLEFNDWSQVKYTSDPPLAGTNRSEENLRIERTYRPTTRVRMGAEVSVPFIEAVVRGGYMFDPSPLVGAMDSDGREYVSLGFSLLLDKQAKLDLAWVHSQWTVTGGGTASAGMPSLLIEDRQSNQLLTTLSFRF